MSCFPYIGSLAGEQNGGVFRPMASALIICNTPAGGDVRGDIGTQVYADFPHNLKLDSPRRFIASIYSFYYNTIDKPLPGVVIYPSLEPLDNNRIRIRTLNPGYSSTSDIVVGKSTWHPAFVISIAKALPGDVAPLFTVMPLPVEELPNIYS